MERGEPEVLNWNKAAAKNTCPWKRKQNCLKRLHASKQFPKHQIGMLLDIDGLVKEGGSRDGEKVYVWNTQI